MGALRWATSGVPVTRIREAEVPPDAENARWLDRASAAVETRLNQLGTNYLRTLVRSFEQRWRQAEAAGPPPAAPANP